jgi:hypothetical protein
VTGDTHNAATTTTTTTRTARMLRTFFEEKKKGYFCWISGLLSPVCVRYNIILLSLLL